MLKRKTIHRYGKYVLYMLCMISSVSVTAQDTQAKHIYDSSERFFNWKNYPGEVYWRIDSGAVKNATRVFVNKLKTDKNFWYVNATEKFQDRKVLLRQQLDSMRKADAKAAWTDEQFWESDQSMKGPGATVLWMIVAIILFAGLIYFLVVNKLNVFARADHAVLSVQGIDDQVNIFELPYRDLLQKAYTDKNFRLAIRILYLQTLKLLSEKELITYQSHHSNLFYIRQLQQSKYFQDFFSITRNYEYVWYGKFDIPEIAFKKLEQHIVSFQQELNSR